MSITSKTRKHKITSDYSIYFNKWVELGSLIKVQKWCGENGLINPDTGNPPTVATIRNGALRWISNNPKEAYTAYVESGSDLTYEEYMAWLAEYLEPVLTNYGKYPRAYIKWVKKHKLTAHSEWFQRVDPDDFENNDRYSSLRKIVDRVEL